VSSFPQSCWHTNYYKKGEFLMPAYNS